MKPVRTFKVRPAIPERLSMLEYLSNNLWWSWNYDCVSLFRRLDPDLWEATEHNPIKLLGIVDQGRLDELSTDTGFLEHYERVANSFKSYVEETKWCEQCYGKKEPTVAYFSAEFGISESLPIYSGGLGILAGDHLKSSSDLGIPLVGIGLLYQKGYFRQYLNYEGWQGERYPVNDFYNMPITEVIDKEGNDISVQLSFPKGDVTAKIWQAKVGNITLYLLDTNVEQNIEEYRSITDELYGGEQERRIQQEMVLGIGGVRAIDKLGIEPMVYHMNEGHSAFLGLERIRLLINRDGISLEEAVVVAKAGSIFTTHTPVPAGIDVFPIDLVKKYFSNYITDLGLSMEHFLEFGWDRAGGAQTGFSMAVLAFNLSDSFNGVSRLHGQVSQNLFSELWPDLPDEEVPISSITNGVHHRSWISHEMEGLYIRYAGERWLTNPEDQEVWQNVSGMPDKELWDTHEMRRDKLVMAARDMLERQLIKRGAPSAEVNRAGSVLNPKALTIGFARRFATYKRADLVLRNPDRLAEILGNKDMPVQIIFSGKAHPRDNPGKELIRDLIGLAERDDFRDGIVFIEDYDMNIARYLVQGVDIWLNTPRRLYEASGTSGMKAAANGALNMSILDGWWDEAYAEGVGWAIGKGEEYDDIDYQYDVEANAIYDLLQKEVIPLFYTRDNSGVPREWVKHMKSSIMRICPVFNSHRMVFDYNERFYVDSEIRLKNLIMNDYERARRLSGYKERLKRSWDRIRIEGITCDVGNSMIVGGKIGISVKVSVDGIGPDEIDVQVFEGKVESDGNIRKGRPVSLVSYKELGKGAFEYSGGFSCSESGHQGYTVRILPKFSDLKNPYMPGFIKWA